MINLKILVTCLILGSLAHAENPVFQIRNGIVQVVDGETGKKLSLPVLNGFLAAKDTDFGGTKFNEVTPFKLIPIAGHEGLSNWPELPVYRDYMVSGLETAEPFKYLPVIRQQPGTPFLEIGIAVKIADRDINVSFYDHGAPINYSLPIGTTHWMDDVLSKWVAEIYIDRANGQLKELPLEKSSPSQLIQNGNAHLLRELKTTEMDSKEFVKRAMLPADANSIDQLATTTWGRWNLDPSKRADALVVRSLKINLNNLSHESLNHIIERLRQVVTEIQPGNSCKRQMGSH